VLTRGPHVMQGYWRAPAATQDALTHDGWLHTGVRRFAAPGLLSSCVRGTGCASAGKTACVAVVTSPHPNTPPQGT
jgi:hypothetical protein